jgi:hypothetical protein
MRTRWLALRSTFIAVSCAVLSLASGCGGDEGGASIAETMTLDCAWSSLCGDDTFLYCLSSIGDIDEVSIGVFLVQTNAARRDCVAGARSCSDYLACGSAGDVVAPPSGASCERGSFCADGLLVLCVDDGDPVFALAVPAGKTCSADGTWMVDADAEACSDDACDGPLMKACANGETYTFDCRSVDPDYACVLDENDRPGCEIPADRRECADDPFDNNRDSAHCEGTLVVGCINGKRYEVDCGALAAGGTCAEQPGTASASCAVE